MRALLPLLLLAGCSEFHLFGGGRDDEPDTPAPDTDDDTAPRACEYAYSPPVTTTAEISCSDPWAPLDLVREQTLGAGETALVQSAAVADLDADGSTDLVAIVYAHDGASEFTGAEAWNPTTGTRLWTYANDSLDTTALPAIGDLDGDGRVEVIVSTWGGSERPWTVIGLAGHDGAVLWETTLAVSEIGWGLNAPALADLDGDGRAEVVIGRVILDSAGERLAVGGGGQGAVFGPNGLPTGSHAFPVDVDGDGLLEIFAGNTLYRADGSTVWATGLEDGYSAAADFDGDGQLDFVAVSLESIVGIDSDGTLAWSADAWADSTGEACWFGPPAVDDLDRDGLPEILVSCGDYDIAAIRWGGETMWRAPVSQVPNVNGLSTADLDMDGYPEVLVAGQTGNAILAGLDGTVRWSDDRRYSNTQFKYPIVADVDDDGEVEIVIGSFERGDVEGGIAIYGSGGAPWMPGRPIWNQYTYHIDNVNDDGSIPRSQPPFASRNSLHSAGVAEEYIPYMDVAIEIVEVCELECDRDRVPVVFRVHNQGNAELPAGLVVAVTAGEGGPELARATIASAIPVRSTSGTERLTVSAAELGDAPLVLTVDPGGIEQCDPTDDVAVFGPVCD